VIFSKLSDLIRYFIEFILSGFQFYLRIVNFLFFFNYKSIYFSFLVSKSFNFLIKSIQLISNNILLTIIIIYRLIHFRLNILNKSKNILITFR